MTSVHNAFMDYTESDVKTWDRTSDKGFFYVKIPGQAGNWKSSKQRTREKAIQWALVQARGGYEESVTVQEFAKDFFIRGKCEYIDTREDDGVNREDSYWADLRAILENYVFPTWGKHPMATIQPAPFHKWLSGLISERKGTKLSSRTRKRILSTVQTIWSWAVFKGAIKNNPMLSVPRIVAKGVKRRIFNKSELAVIFPQDIKSAWSDPWGLFFLIAYETGLRPQEICALHWEDWRPKSKAFIVWRAVDKKSNIKALKTAEKGVSKKASPVSDRVVELLGEPSTGLIFKRPDGRPLRVDTAGKVFCDGVDRLGIERDGRTLYCLRHGANTRFRTELGDDQARALMGHTTEAMTENYDDPEEEDLLRRVGR